MPAIRKFAVKRTLHIHKHYIIRQLPKLLPSSFLRSIAEARLKIDQPALASKRQSGSEQKHRSPRDESGVLRTSKSKGVVNAAQMKPPVCWFKLPHLDNDLTLLHDYSSFIQPLPRWEGSAGLWIGGSQKVLEGWEACVNGSDLDKICFFYDPPTPLKIIVSLTFMWRLPRYVWSH